MWVQVGESGSKWRIVGPLGCGSCWMGLERGIDTAGSWREFEDWEAKGVLPSQRDLREGWMQQRQARDWMDGRISCWMGLREGRATDVHKEQ